MKRIVLILITVFLISSCEDPAPYDYIPENILVAIMNVDEPIKDIELRKSQNLLDETFENDLRIKNAEIIIKDANDVEYKLEYSDSLFYYYPDQDYTVEADMEYSIVVKFGENMELELTGTTTTPTRTKWVNLPDYYLDYPKNITSPANDTLYDKIEWEAAGNGLFYVLSLTNLDTLNYGKYLEKPRGEKNSRLEKPWLSENQFKSIQSRALIQNTKSPIVWNTFKWYGLHELSILSVDENYLMYFLQVQGTRSMNQILQSVEGDGYGFFASSHKISYEFFLVKE